MVKKQNSNVWLVYLIALIAIVALILGAVAISKANMTGNAFWDFLRAKEKPVCGDGVCEPPENNLTCPEDCVIGGDGPEGVGGGNYGLLGNVYLTNGGDFEKLKGLKYSVEYDLEGNVLLEMINGFINENYNTDTLIYGEDCPTTTCVTSSDCDAYGTCSCTGKEGCPSNEKYCYNCQEQIA